MLALGSEILTRLHSGEILQAKMVFNNQGAILFPVTREHRDAKAEGLTYEDNYAGNALAAMLHRDLIEIRFHKSYNDRDVARMINQLKVMPELALLASMRVTYQGKPIRT